MEVNLRLISCRNILDRSKKSFHKLWVEKNFIPNEYDIEAFASAGAPIRYLINPIKRLISSMCIELWLEPFEFAKETRPTTRDHPTMNYRNI